MKPNNLSRYLNVGIYALLNTILAVLLLITPGDAIRQALDNKQLYNVFAIAGSYLLTILLAITLYASRLCTDNATLKAIPKTWIPIEKGDVSKKVRKMVSLSLRRSAVLAWNARPRLQLEPTTTGLESDQNLPDTIRRLNKSNERSCRSGGLDSSKSDQIIANFPYRPVWGNIAHKGWSSPMSSEFPHLQYLTVILELPHLIEAKVVSLASSLIDDGFNFSISQSEAVDILKRPATMSLRDYVGYLSQLSIIRALDAATRFLSLYEYARFSENPLSENEFQILMEYFAEILRSIQGLDPEVLADIITHTERSHVDSAEVGRNLDIARRQEQISAHCESGRSESNGTIQRSYSWHSGYHEFLPDSIQHSFDNQVPSP